MTTVTYEPRTSHEFPTAFGPALLEVGHGDAQVVVAMTPEAARVFAQVVAASPRATAHDPDQDDAFARVVVDLLAAAALAESPTPTAVGVSGHLPPRPRHATLHVLTHRRGEA